ncbi:hypothetical protein [Parvularcula oceani]|uniref:hypothetical protein n=1 Tax=Parvularcula oceani TaxID=1247963 RepID=UPI0004E1C2FB|nr:hypothetical protein [Parvularcula oceani]
MVLFVLGLPIGLGTVLPVPAGSRSGEQDALDAAKVRPVLPDAEDLDLLLARFDRMALPAQRDIPPPPPPAPDPAAALRRVQIIGIIVADTEPVLLARHGGSLRWLRAGDSAAGFRFTGIDARSALFSDGERTVRLSLPDAAAQGVQY